MKANLCQHFQLDTTNNQLVHNECMSLCKIITFLTTSFSFSHKQVILFTVTIYHKRAEFLFDSRILFERLFLVNFDPEHPLQEQVAYSIQDVSKELELIVTNVREGGREGDGERRRGRKSEREWRGRRRKN